MRVIVAMVLTLCVIGALALRHRDEQLYKRVALLEQQTDEHSRAIARLTAQVEIIQKAPALQR